MNRKQECDLDVMLARAQIAMAFVFATGIFGLVAVLIFWHSHIDGPALTIITSVIASLITVLTLQQNFFYARQRPHSPVDPPELPDPIDGAGKSQKVTSSVTKTTEVENTDTPKV